MSSGPDAETVEGARGRASVGTLLSDASSGAVEGTDGAIRVSLAGGDTGGAKRDRVTELAAEAAGLESSVPGASNGIGLAGGLRGES